MHWTGLWRHADFMKLWLGQTISLFGTQVKFLALPLTAILILDATPGQMGLLSAIESLPAIFFGLFVGVWVDRRRRRPILIAADVGRMFLVLAIPVAALLGVLRIEILYLSAFGTGALGLLFGIAYQSYLPTLIAHRQIVEGNSKLELSRSGAEIVGPGLAGFLTQWFSAPVALVADALSFGVSAVSLILIRTPEPAPTAHEKRDPMLRAALDGLKVVWGDPTLRALLGCASTINVFNTLLETVFLLYMTDKLGLEAGVIGLIFASGSIGFMAGALVAERVTRRIGLGPTIILGVLITAGSDFVLPLVQGPVVFIMLLLIGAQLCFGLGLTLYNVGQASLRQSITPNHLRGRMNATFTVTAAVLAPVAALLGGALGETIGLQATLLVAASGEVLAVLWLVFSTVRTQREQPEALD
ncbi:MAG: MFS transporter [Anaerolineae bacterium]|nr:MFS transporter [Anaerolineae bacterium]